MPLTEFGPLKTVQNWLIFPKCIENEGRLIHHIHMFRIRKGSARHLSAGETWSTALLVILYIFVAACSLRVAIQARCPASHRYIEPCRW